MTACDTNVLARAILGDDAKQAAAARRALDEAAAGDGLFIPLVVLIELVWVLDGAGLDRATIALALEMLLTTQGVTIEQTLLVDQARRDFAKGPAGFADYFIAASAKAAGCRSLVTFDRKLAKDPRAKLLKA